jgi:hypothetical protein
MHTHDLFRSFAFSRARALYISSLPLSPLSLARGKEGTQKSNLWMPRVRGCMCVWTTIAVWLHFLYCHLPDTVRNTNMRLSRYKYETVSTDTVRNTSMRLSQQLYETFALSLCVCICVYVPCAGAQKSSRCSCQEARLRPHPTGTASEIVDARTHATYRNLNVHMSAASKACQQLVKQTLIKLSAPVLGSKACQQLVKHISR